MAAFDMGDPLSVVSPGGVGFDINCGVRLLRTNLHEKDVLPVKVSTLFLTNTYPCYLSKLSMMCLLGLTYGFQKCILHEFHSLVIAAYIYNSY
jgi:hypothetical protein